MFMAAVDQTLLATATPAIAASLGGLSDTSWIAVAYLLASATSVPVYGRLGDLHGRRKLLLVALGVFTLGSAACGGAQTLPQLVAARLLQGLGGGGLMMLSQALIGELVAPRERARFQGYFAIIFTTASIAGPVIGGVVVSQFSWRWLFLANLPLAAFAAWRLCRLRHADAHHRPGAGRDVAGLLLFALGAVSGLLWLTSVGHHFRWVSQESAVLVATAVLALGALAWHETRHASPFLPVDLLRERVIRRSVILVTLFAACMFSMVFFLPIYLQLGHRLSAKVSGLLLLPLTAGMVISSVTSSRIVARTGEPKLIPVIGMAGASIALLLLGLLPPNTLLVIALGFLTGIGFGTVMPTNQVVVQTMAGRARLGAVTAMVSLARSVGAAVGAAVLGALVFGLLPDADSGTVLNAATQGDRDAIVRAFHHAFLFASGIAAIAAMVAGSIPRVTLWERTPRPVSAPT
jgi:EmrB/QacA subfamily drug resistance transporter